MARKPEGTSAAATKASAAREAESLRGLRTQIDKLDLQILKLINDRAGVAAEIGKVKTDTARRSFRRPAKKKS